MQFVQESSELKKDWLLEHNTVFELPILVSTNLPCKAIDELFVLKSMDEHLPNNLVCILNYETMIVIYHYYVLFKCVLRTWYTIRINEKCVCKHEVCTGTVMLKSMEECVGGLI